MADEAAKAGLKLVTVKVNGVEIRVPADQVEQVKAAMAKKDKGITYKVSEKKALSMYGLGRFPFTAYKSQWRRIVEEVKSGRLEEALDLYDGDLADKADSVQVSE